MEAGLPEQSAGDQVARAFQLVIQISKVAMGRRVISEITEVEPVREGNEQRRNDLYKWDQNYGEFVPMGAPTPNLRRAWARYGVSWDEIPGRR